MPHHTLQTNQWHHDKLQSCRTSEFDMELPRPHITDQPTLPSKREETTCVHSWNANKVQQPFLYSEQDICPTRNNNKNYITKQGPNTEPNTHEIYSKH